MGKIIRELRVKPHRCGMKRYSPSFSIIDIGIGIGIMTPPSYTIRDSINLYNP